MEAEKLVSPILVIIVLGILIVSLFYVIGSPLRKKLTNLKCEFIGCEDIDLSQTQQTQQTQQVQTQTFKNVVNVMSSQFKTCGQYDPNSKCRCTSAFGNIGSNLVMIRQEKDSIRISEQGQNWVPVKDYTLYYDDGDHDLDENHKLNEGDLLWLVREEKDSKFGVQSVFDVKIKRKDQEKPETLKTYKGDPRLLTEFLNNNIGLFKTVIPGKAGDTIGLYLPNEDKFDWRNVYNREDGWFEAKIRESDPIKNECIGPTAQSTKKPTP